MRMPILAGSVERSVSAMRMTGGVTPSFCSPCILGHQVCCDVTIFPPSVNCHTQACGGGTVCSPCIPFLNRKFCVPGGLQPC